MHRPLQWSAVAPVGPLARLGREFLHFSEIDSTNTHLLRRAAELPDGCIAIAESQTAGRGRLGRTWRSPRGASVMLSVLLHEPADSPLRAAASWVAGLAACEAIDRATPCRPRLRWPNDLVIGTRKLGGILVETTPLSASAGSNAPAEADSDEQPPQMQNPKSGIQNRNGVAIVLGIGINCLQQRGHFADELATKATSLEIESTQPIDRCAVARELIAALDVRIADALRDESALETARQAWLARCADIGEPATFIRDGREYRGIVREFVGDGDMLVRLDDGEEMRFEAAKTTRLWPGESADPSRPR